MRQRHDRAREKRLWRLPPRSFAAFAVLALLSFATPSLTPVPALAEEYAQPISNKFNTTGRQITLPVPLEESGLALGEVLVRIAPDDSVSVEKSGLAERLQKIADAGTLERLASAGGGDTFAPLAALEAIGLRVRFDYGLQELHIDLSAEQHTEGEVRLRGRRTPIVSEARAEPAFISGYVNIIAGADHDWGTGSNGYDDGQDGETSGRLEFESAVRAGNVVIENTAVYSGDVDGNECPTGAECVYGHVAGLKRSATRAIYDLQEDEVRLSAGDTEALGTGYQRATELFGLSAEKSPRKLNPGESSAPSGSGTFRLDRASDIEVIINGASIQRFHLRPGIYNLRDLPLSTGANGIELVISDDTGERRTLQFTSFFDGNLLAEGKSEWGAAGGVPSYVRDEERIYSSDGTMGTGYFRYGLSDEVTGELALQADTEVASAGGGVLSGTPWGIVGLFGAASTSAAGAGAAADFYWDLVNFEGLTGARGESLHFDARLRSTDFHLPGDFLTVATGILYPETNYWLRLNASYTAPIGEEITATLAARYQFADEDRQSISPYTFKGDRYGADITLSRPIGRMASASVLAGYSNESYLTSDLGETEAKPEFRAAMRVNMRTDEGPSISAAYDTIDKMGTVSAYHSEGNGLGRWDTSVDLQQRGSSDTLGVSGAIGYQGNRMQLRLSQYADYEGAGFDSFSPSTRRQRTSVRAGTAIAFADGMVAVGAPVRGGAFAIVQPHASIGDQDVIVGTADYVRAEADALGPALVSELPAYMPSSIPVDVPDLPVGYSIGAGAFDTFAPYKAGYALEVGSDYAVSVLGTLLMADGTPVALLTGFASPESNSSKKVSVFTNAAGKFGAEGLAPGRWIIEMDTEGARTRFIVDVPEGATGVFKAGTLMPVGT